MNFKELTAWVEEHPGYAILIGGGVVILLLWLLGAFSSSKASDGGQSSLAAAYYAAEAQQAVIGGQIQMANIAATASTAQTKLQADAATTINQQNVQGTVAIVGDQLTASLHNADVAASMNASNNATQLEAYKSGIIGAESLAYINGIMPQELATTGGFGNFFLSNGQYLSVNTGSPVGNPNSYQGMGFTPEQANALALHDFGQNVTIPTLPTQNDNPTSRFVVEDLLSGNADYLKSIGMGTLPLPG